MKVDFKKSINSYAAKRNQFAVLDVPKMQYLKIDGHGDPGESEYALAVEALFPVAFSLKFLSKKLLDKDYVVPPLEGLWWAEDMETFTTRRDKSQWDWTSMIMTPDWITLDMFEQTCKEVSRKKSPESLDKLRLESLDEGACVQTLHLGSFEDVGPVLDKMHNEFIPQNGLSMRDRHHEIYLSDFRRVSPEKLRTILRQPVSQQLA
ncbi:MAG: hypothetical protein CMQ21_02320 [Gammaproteobacteria bacterium]|jgi:hypothetical protein|nr:hypothetical protein [Gammaproteobacteria bacterium]|tara:strand:- start:35438 stop:36055 length:618 start_codon:yes stop_codon:yes gene_type:complete